ncbi:hypothetical protein D3C75_617220 [compost metagenome]
MNGECHRVARFSIAADRAVNGGFLLMRFGDVNYVISGDVINGDSVVQIDSVNQCIGGALRSAPGNISGGGNHGNFTVYKTA